MEIVMKKTIKTSVRIASLFFPPTPYILHFCISLYRA